MPWGYIIPCLLIGGFIGWLVGVTKGHAETHQRIEANERRMTALLTELHWSLRTRVEMMDVLVGMTSEPRNADLYASAWATLRAELIDDQAGEGARFFKAKDSV